MSNQVLDYFFEEKENANFNQNDPKIETAMPVQATHPESISTDFHHRVFSPPVDRITTNT